MTPQLTVIRGGKSSTPQPQVLTTGVNITNNCYVPAGAVITTQIAANRLRLNAKPLHLVASTTPYNLIPYMEAI